MDDTIPTGEGYVTLSETEYKELQGQLARVTAERDSYRSDIDRYTWNLAGCDTIASGYLKPGEYDKALALPALDSVSRMATDIAALRARVAELEKDNDQYRADFRAQQKKLTEHDRELAQTTAALSQPFQNMNTADKANRHRLAENVVQSTAAKLYWELERRLEEIPTRFPGVTVERHGEEIVLSGLAEQLEEAQRYLVS